MTKRKKKTMKDKNNTIFIYGTRTLEFEKSELEKVQIEGLLNKIRKDLGDVMD
jgi:hypothetical protein